jgi:hypothetical protein
MFLWDPSSFERTDNVSQSGIETFLRKRFSSVSSPGRLLIFGGISPSFPHPLRHCFEARLQSLFVLLDQR